MRIEIGAIIAALESKARNSDPLLWVGGAPTGQPAVFNAGSLPQGCRCICKVVRLFDSAPRLQVRNVVDLTFNGASL
jgi:hypothetical protein